MSGCVKWTSPHLHITTSPDSSLLLRRLLRRVVLEIVEVQQGVEQHVELAEVLPPIARVAGKQDDASLSFGLIDDRRPVPDFGRSAHQTAQYVLVSSGIPH